MLNFHIYFFRLLSKRKKKQQRCALLWLAVVTKLRFSVSPFRSYRGLFLNDNSSDWFFLLCAGWNLLVCLIFAFTSSAHSQTSPRSAVQFSPQYWKKTMFTFNVLILISDFRRPQKCLLTFVVDFFLFFPDWWNLNIAPPLVRKLSSWNVTRLLVHYNVICLH